MKISYCGWCRSLCAGLVALLVVAGLTAAAAAGDSSFKKPRAEIVAAVKTIGLLPLEVTAIVPNPDAVAERYESQVTMELEQSGFKVVKPAVMREIRERLKQTLGGLYDPVTGREVPGKVKAFNDYARNEYLATQKVDGLLWVGIIIRPARVTNVSASWDDVSDSPTGRSGFGGFLANTLLESNFQGTVPALSVGVVLSDTRGESLYSRAGGLQVLEYVHRYGHTGYGFRRVNAQSIMTDPARDARALALALGPLTHGDAQAPKAAIAAAPIAATEPAAADNALRVPRPELLARYRTVAIGPLIVGDLPQRAEVEQHYHELLAARLAQLGFNVAGGTEYADLWATEVAAVNGFYDTFTGRMQPAKLQASRKHVFSILHDKYAIDAVVLPQLAVRPVTYQRGEARWDGVVEQVDPKKKGGSLLFGNRYFGSVNAMSVVVRIADADDATQFEDSGGIQIIEHAVEGRSVDVPRPELFADAAKNAQAVTVALRELDSAPQDK